MTKAYLNLVWDIDEKPVNGCKIILYIYTSLYIYFSLFSKRRDEDLEDRLAIPDHKVPYSNTFKINHIQTGVFPQY